MTKSLDSLVARFTRTSNNGIMCVPQPILCNTVRYFEVACQNHAASRHFTLEGSMEVTIREWWTIVHGMGLGAIFLLAFAGGLAGLWSLRTEWITVPGLHERLRRLTAGTWILAIVDWLTVIVGTWLVYPWYRARPPEGTTELRDFPRYFLLASENTAGWHEFGMEWKEHTAFLSPILATAVAFIVWRYRDQLAGDARMRYAVMTLYILAFVFAAIAGAFGAFITKAAPVH
jgi:hypothetical protein